jgi:hypothetical protein
MSVKPEAASEMLTPCPVYPCPCACHRQGPHVPTDECEQPAAAPAERCVVCHAVEHVGYIDHEWVPFTPLFLLLSLPLLEEFVQLICSECAARRQEALAHDAALRAALKKAKEVIKTLTIADDRHFDEMSERGRRANAAKARVAFLEQETTYARESRKRGERAASALKEKP